MKNLKIQRKHFLQVLNQNLGKRQKSPDFRKKQVLRKYYESITIVLRFYTDY
jgi:hypothetical protein|nr:MAG TPA: hypothetical protein [Caudoviricetes sp.]